MSKNSHGGRPKIFTEELISEVFQDFIRNNPNADITPTALSIWSKNKKWDNVFWNGKAKAIPRYVWYTKEWNTKIKEYNNLPYFLRTEDLDDTTPFNTDRILEKCNGNLNKLRKELKFFEQRANIALDIATEAISLKKQLEIQTCEYKKLEEKYDKSVIQASFYKRKYEELIFDSVSEEKRIEKGIKKDFLSISALEREEIDEQLNYFQLARSVDIDELEIIDEFSDEIKKAIFEE